MPTFRGNNIFGYPVSQNGPIPSRRNLREQLPGVRGYRTYNLAGYGPDTKTFTLNGRITSTSLGALSTIIQGYQDLISTFGIFVDNGGTIYRNCELLDYRQSGKYMRVSIAGVLYYTVEVSATLEQASP